jgi:anaphase-promoting complex subunit 5
VRSRLPTAETLPANHFIAPGKIALLVLVELFAESRFPNESVLPVVSFVIRHLVRPRDSTTFVLGLEEIKNVTLDYSSTVVGRTIFDLLVMELWYINSFDALHSFFADAQNFLRDPEKEEASWQGAGTHGKRRLISPTSILGCFIRRASLEFVRLQFNDANSLWRAFVEFREPTLPLWKKRKLDADRLSFDMNVKGLSLNEPIVQKVYGIVSEGRNC